MRLRVADSPWSVRPALSGMQQVPRELRRQGHPTGHQERGVERRRRLLQWEHLPQLYLSKKYERELRSRKVHTAVSLTINTLKVQWDDRDPNRGQNVRETITSTFALAKDEACSDKNETRYRFHNHPQALVELRMIGAMLGAHNTVIKPSSDPDVFSPREYIEHRCTIGGMRGIDALLLSMATGLVEFDGERYLKRDNQDYQRQICSTVAASDILLHILRKKPGHFQLIMHELLVKQKLTRNFQDFLPVDLRREAGRCTPRVWTLKLKSPLQ